MATTASLEVVDIVIIVLYFAVVMAVGLFATYRANRSSAKGFFLAEKSMTFIPITGSIYASNIGAPTFIGLAGSAAAFGFAPIMFEWHATYMLILLGWIFVPIYVASASFTMPEYLQKRFGGRRLRVYYAVVTLALSVISGISGEIYSGTLFMTVLLGWDPYLSTIVILAITAVYTIGGGLTAVMYTDTLQSVVLVIGSAILAGMAVIEVGGYEALVNRFTAAASNITYLTESQSHNLSCGFPPADSFHIFRGQNSAYPWTGMVFGLTLLAGYYWCTNQIIVQRCLACKDISHSKAACVIASYLKVLPFFLFVLPGMASRILYPNDVGCADPDISRETCANTAGCTNIAYPLLVLNILPAGLRGLMLAALLAALMSSLTSQYNSTSSVFTIDLWNYMRPKASEFEIVLVGRLFGLFMVALSVAWLPILQVIQGGQLWDYLQSISSFITPPWFMAFVFGMLWPRCTERGIWWGLIAGLITGVTRMGLEFSFAAPKCGSGDVDNRPDVITKVHYLNFAIILATVTSVVIVAVTIITPPRTKQQLRRVTWWTRNDPDFPELSDDSDISSSEDEAPQEEFEPTKTSCPRKTYNIICGATDKPQKLTKEQKLEQMKKTSSIEENKFWSKVCDYNAVIVLAATCFIIGFYA